MTVDNDINYRRFELLCNFNIDNRKIPDTFAIRMIFYSHVTIKNKIFSDIYTIIFTNIEIKFTFS